MLVLTSCTSDNSASPTKTTGESQIIQSPSDSQIGIEGNFDTIINGQVLAFLAEDNSQYNFNDLLGNHLFSLDYNNTYITDYGIYHFENVRNGIESNLTLTRINERNGKPMWEISDQNVLVSDAETTLFPQLSDTCRLMHGNVSKPLRYFALSVSKGEEDYDGRTSEEVFVIDNSTGTLTANVIAKPGPLGPDVIGPNAVVVNGRLYSIPDLQHLSNQKFLGYGHGNFSADEVCRAVGSTFYATFSNGDFLGGGGLSFNKRDGNDYFGNLARFTSKGRPIWTLKTSYAEVIAWSQQKIVVFSGGVLAVLDAQSGVQLYTLDLPSGMTSDDDIYNGFMLNENTVFFSTYTDSSEKSFIMDISQ